MGGEQKEKALWWNVVKQSKWNNRWDSYGVWWSYGDCYVKYMCVNICAMLDWIIGFGQKTAEIYFLGMSAQLVSSQNEMLLWPAGMT